MISRLSAALAFFVVPAIAGHPFIVKIVRPCTSRSTEPPAIHSPTSRSKTTLISLAATALRGGSDDVVNGEDPAKAAAAKTAGGDGETKSEEDAAGGADDELSVEATDEEVAPAGALDGDAVSISADAFLHPAHVGDDDAATDEDDEEEEFFFAAEDEDEGSTTPVTPDDEDIAADAPGETPLVVDDASVYADADVTASSSAVDADESVDQTEEAVEDNASGAAGDAVGGSAVVDSAEEADFTRQQHGGGYTEDDSAAYVDRMDLADDEGEEVMVGTETVAESIVDADSIVDAEDDIDPLDLSLAQSTREELQRQQQATVAAATEAVAAATAKDAPPSVQYMITRNMKRVLADELGYTEEEVDGMRPDVAAVITSKRLKRPSGGMPDAFYVDGKAPSTTRNRIGQFLKSNVVKRIVMPALVVGSTACIAAFAMKPSATTSRGKNDSSPAAATSIPAVKNEDITAAAEMYNPVSKVSKTNTTAYEEQLDESSLGAFRPDSANRWDLDDTFLDKMITRMLEKLRFRSS